MTDGVREAEVRHVMVDRDGVLNVEGREPVRSPEGWAWERGAVEGLAALGRRGVAVSVVTNQSSVGRGLVTAAEVDGLHEWLAAEIRGLGVDLVGVFVCPHRPEEGCGCRKPAPGLLATAMSAGGFSADRSVMVGDAERDIEAGRRAGTRVARVRTGKGADAGSFDDLSDVAAALGDPQRSFR